MKVRKTSDRVLEITDFPRAIIALGLVLVVGTWIAGAAELIRGDHPPVGILLRVAVVTLVAGGAMLGFWERSLFRFDPDQRTLQWSRSGPFRKADGGVLRFDQISEVVVQTHDHKFRIALLTGDRMIPVTLSYSAGGISKRACEQAKLEIEALLGGSRRGSA